MCYTLTATRANSLCSYMGWPLESFRSRVAVAHTLTLHDAASPLEWVDWGVNGRAGGRFVVLGERGSGPGDEDCRDVMRER